MGFSDSDYAGDLDRRRSTSGYVFQLYDGPVSRCSRRQSCTALSTTEVEFITACEASKEAVWLLRLLDELELKKTRTNPSHG